MARNRFDQDEELEAPFNFANLKFCFTYIKRYLGGLIGALALSAIGSIIGLSGPLFAQKALDEAIPSKDTQQLITLSLLLAGTIVLNIVFNSIRTVIVARVGQSIIHDIRKDLFEHLQKLSFSYYDNRPHGKIFVRVVHYVNAVSDALSNGILNFIIEIVNIVFIIVFMFRVSVPLAAVTMTGLPVVIIFMLIIKPRQRRAWQEVSNKNSNVNAFVQESIDGARVTQAFDRQQENLKILDRIMAERKSAWMHTMRVSNSTWFTTEMTSQLVFSAVYIVGAFVLFPMASFGTLLTMGFYTSRFWQPMISLANIYNNFINAVAYLERIFETLSTPVEVAEAPDAKLLPEIVGRVAFDHVNFGYDKDRLVLKDVSFSVEPGQSIALVGPTGAGKTTIVNLISRFYNIEDGQVLIDGNDVMQATLHSLRGQMGIMLQDSFLFSGTVADNIRYGRPDATDEEVERAAELLHADSFIRKMPDGFQTVVKERGNGLSQGQRQLISFARVLLCNPRILIMDEATSSIDTATEQLVQQGIELLMKGRTSFIVAHRLSSIRNCTRIMYIGDGQIMESGTHDELMRREGYYYRLYMAQYAHL